LAACISSEYRYIYAVYQMQKLTITSQNMPCFVFITSQYNGFGYWQICDVDPSFCWFWWCRYSCFYFELLHFLV